MFFCPTCNKKIKNQELLCPECGSHLFAEQNNVIESIDSDEYYELHPRFVFMYELLPSSIETVWVLILLLIVAVLVRSYFHLRPETVIAFFAFLFLLKDFKVFYRKFRYRNVKYIISNEGIEYSDMSKNITYFIPYEKVKDVRIQCSLATSLFGYGHILVRDRESGIYLDYIANVKEVYDYICEHVDR